VAVIGVGLDLVDLTRAEQMLARHGEHLLGRVLRAGEREYVMSMAYPPRHLAVRLAAKEAVYKALQALDGARAVGWTDIEVERAESGRPSIVLHGLARQIADAAGVRIHVSLSHTDQTAGAVAVVEGQMADDRWTDGQMADG
jgi:holo-[acyl-carrier protein] synthase